MHKLILKTIFLICMAMTSLSAEIKVLAFSGSTRAGSVNRKLIKEAADFAQQMGAQVKLIELKNFNAPFYDGDLEQNEGMPAKAKELRQLMIQSHLILIAAPEYNSSLSAALKNAIDWASRGEAGGASREAFKGKTFVIMSASPGSGGGARGLVHLRAIIESAGGTVFSQQFVLPNAYNAFDDEGRLKNPQQRVELQQLIQSSMR